ncbi:hypothetical protein FHP88_15735 [Sedimenticola selenatireducens]|uniref:Uncharacterized protein n=1 Tax=Sedimenticola selenatireducens TaxID=191960 RepID=A0A557S0F9_9GAMM|nr:hypothetical protein [Sedimenticola selenatireducens]TVO70904.1 hypothetical protein FHP88_15735 [Sedimenticola selenatireducens]
MLHDYQKLIERKVRADADEVTPSDLEDAFDASVIRYSKDRPRTLVRDVIAPGGQVLDLPTDWVPGFSIIQQLEYPIGSIPPVTLDDWEIYQAPAGESVLIGMSLQASVSVRVSFSVFHNVDETTDTIPLVDRDAVASWAAALVCDQLASRYSGDSDPTIQADSVDHGSKSREYASRAKSLRQNYFNDLGIDPKSNSAAGVVVDLDMPNSQGRDRLLHPGRLR